MDIPSEENLLLYDTKFIKQKEYWMNKLPGNIVVTDIGSRNSSKNLETRKNRSELDRVGIFFHGDLTSRLITLGKNSNLSIYLILLTLLKTLIYLYTDNEDIIVISPLYKNKISGETINDTLFIRDSIQEDMTFKELLLKVRQSVLEAYDNQDYPHDKLIEYLFNIQPEPGKKYLSTVECLLKNIHHEKNTEESGTELSFAFVKEEDHVEGHILYDPGLYETYYLEKISKHLVRIFENIIKNIEIKISEISFLSEPEKQQILFEFNDTKLDYPGEKTIQQLFEEQEKKNPGMIAVFSLAPGALRESGNPGAEREGVQSDPGKQAIHVTYNQINQKANQLARTLRKKGVKPGSIAAVTADRTVEHIIGIMAVLKSGGAYTIIDPDYPQARKQIILEDSSAVVLLTQKSIMGWESRPPSEKNQSTLPRDGGKNVLLLDEPGLYKGTAGNPGNINRSQDPAYMLYTSGTTGKPKGAIIMHRSVTNLIFGLKERIYKQYNTPLKVALISPFMFDASVKQVFGALLQGHGLYIVPENDRIDAVRIIEFFKTQKIDISDGTPTHIRMLTEVMEYSPAKFQVKHFIIGGEPLTKKVLEDFFSRFKTAVPKVTNVYGPTECCVDATSYEISREKLAIIDRVPLGKAMPNYLIYILGKNNRLRPLGAAGELCIGGHGVGRGYLKREQLTKMKFVKNPFLEDEATNNMMYHTGDLARWLPDGNIDFLGRIDQQLKVRGFRIELEEIESLLKSHDEIKEALVTAKPDRNGDKYLCAYFVPLKELDGSKLRDYLSKYLPDYMIPAYFTPIKNVPLTKNGKVDKKALPNPGIKSEDEYTPPANEVEKKLIEIWSLVLGIEREIIGTNANFFELGGHSLNAIKLISRIYKEFDLEVPIVKIFNNPRIKDISTYILNSQIGNFVEEEYILLNKEKTRKLFVFPPGIGYGTAYQKFSTFLVDYSIYAFNFIEDENRIKKYTDLITSISTVKPCVLIGYSAGGNLAFEVTKELEKEGYEVSDLIFIDSNLKIENELLSESEFNKNLETYATAASEYLKPYGLESVKNKVIEKVAKYLNYFHNLKNIGIVNANIHLITNEEKRGKEESASTPSVSWEKLTKNNFKIYPGYGEHPAMLSDGYIEKNIEILKKILAHIYSP
jgi:amino acid adenylation domain-containing protein